MSSDKFRLIKSGWDRDCLYNIQDGDRILVRWEDGTETFEIARTDSSASYGQEQGTFLGQSYMGTYHELYAVKVVHGRESLVDLDGLYVYAESMDTFEEFKADRAAEEEARRERERSATHMVLLSDDELFAMKLETALDRVAERRRSRDEQG